MGDDGYNTTDRKRYQGMRSWVCDENSWRNADVNCQTRINSHELDRNWNRYRESYGLPSLNNTTRQNKNEYEDCDANGTSHPD